MYNINIIDMQLKFDCKSECKYIENVQREQEMV